MKIALVVIAICSVVRIIQNQIQLTMLVSNYKGTRNMQDEFIKSLYKSNKEFAKGFEHDLRKFVEESEDK